MRIKHIAVFFSLVFGLFLVVNTTQAKSSKLRTEDTKVEEDQDNLASEYLAQIMGAALSSNSSSKLYQFINEWIGTPYRLGGNSKRGVDCSGFVSNIYAKAFNMMIGENSRKIFSMSKPVDLPELKVGDLVFFRTRGRQISHVGIYLGDSKFAHSSSSKGVQISNLGEGYWRRHFYKGGQIRPEYE